MPTSGRRWTSLAVLIDHEEYLSNAHLLRRRGSNILPAGNQRNLQIGAQIVVDEAEVAEAASAQPGLTALRELLDGCAAPLSCAGAAYAGDRHRRCSISARTWLTALTGPINLAGLPALVLPVAVKGDLPASLQLVGPTGGEETLIAVGRIVEAGGGRGLSGLTPFHSPPRPA